MIFRCNSRFLDALKTSYSQRSINDAYAQEVPFETIWNSKWHLNLYLVGSENCK